jgi:hypothetical protein
MRRAKHTPPPLVRGPDLALYWRARSIGLLALPESTDEMHLIHSLPCTS